MIPNHRLDPVRISAQDASLILKRLGAPQHLPNRILRALGIVVTAIVMLLVVFVGLLIYSFSSKFALEPLPVGIDSFTISVISLPNSSQVKRTAYEPLTPNQSLTLHQFIDALFARKDWSHVIPGANECEIRISAKKSDKSIFSVTYVGSQKAGHFYFGKKLLNATPNDLNQLYEIVSADKLRKLAAQTCRI